MSRGGHCEVLTDEDGTVIARVQVTRCLTDDERKAMTDLFKFAIQHHDAQQRAKTEEADRG